MNSIKNSKNNISREDWIKWLHQKAKSPIDNEVCEALEEIGKISDVTAFDSIKNLIYHKNPDVRWRVAYALGRLGLEKSIPYLKDGLMDDNHGVNFWSAWALGGINHFRAMKVLIQEGLNHKHWRVRNCSVESLDRCEENQDFIVTPLINALDDSWPIIRQNCVKVLGKIQDTRAIAPLCNKLQDNYVRKFAAESLAKMGKYSIPPLLKILKFPTGIDIETHIWILKALGWIDEERCIEALGIGLKQRNWRIRRTAAKLLGETKYSQFALEILKTASEGEQDKHVLGTMNQAIKSQKERLDSIH